MNETSTMGNETSKTRSTKMSEAEVVREHVPFEDGKGLHGVTFDGKLVWFARNDELVAFDPETSKVVRTHHVPGADAGTAFDGKLIYQLAKGEIVVLEPETGRVVRKLPAPGKGADSGMAYADGYLWIGQGRGAKINKVDAKTGEVVKTLSSDRFVTGVSCVDGALWHGAAVDGKPTELRRLASDGSVEETLTVPVELIAGVEHAGNDSFWCAGEKGKLRLVRRKTKH
jgi:outer membrane protein assembly factor BamB